MKIKLFALLLFCCSTAFSKDINFNNFNKVISLSQTKENNYQLKESNQVFQLSDRLIIKTEKNFKRKKLKSLITNQETIKELYLGHDFDYLSFELKADYHLDKALKKAKKIRGIQLAQPDVSQIKTLSHGDHPPAKKRTTKKRKNIAVQEYYYKKIGLEKLWENTKGKGIKIAVIDEGFDLSHSEFKGLNIAMQYDFDKQSLDASPLAKNERHGTQIAGILFAAHDKRGLRGIAPESELIAIRQPDTWTSRTLQAFQIAKLAGADIINCSWHSEILLEPLSDIIKDLAQHGRNGKGVAVIFAAGNDGEEIQTNSIEPSIHEAIVVGSSRINPIKILPKSNKGKTVDMYVFGTNSKTTHPKNKLGRFAGTSLASSIVSGLSALILSESPELSLDQLLTKLKTITNNK